MVEAKAVDKKGPWGWVGLNKKPFWGLVAVVLVINLPFIHYFLRGQAAVTTTITRAAPFSDNFDRAEIGPNYVSHGGLYRIENGWLHSPSSQNNPLWLQAKLPRDVAVEFDARSESADGDIKVEIFGDGRDHASGYVAILGGWSNTVSILARLNEHGGDRKENKEFKVEKSKAYHCRVERKGSLLRLLVDGNELLRWDDKEPLEGEGHDRFGMSSWNSDIFFDNLTITPL